MCRASGASILNGTTPSAPNHERFTDDSTMRDGPQSAESHRDDRRRLMLRHAERPQRLGQPDPAPTEVVGMRSRQCVGIESGPFIGHSHDCPVDSAFDTGRYGRTTNGGPNCVAEQFAGHQNHIVDIRLGISFRRAPLPDLGAQHTALIVVRGKVKFEVRHGHLQWGA